MPVKSTDCLLGDFLTGTTIPNMIDMDEPNSELLLSDDIWKKFEIDFPAIDDIFNELDFNNFEDSLFTEFDDTDNCEIRNHDCMWAGHCASKQHPVDEPRLIVERPPTTVLPQFVPSCTKSRMIPFVTPGASITPAGSIKTAPPHPAPSQYSLLKPFLRTNEVPVVNTITPQTPPMSDDEEIKVKTTQVLQLYPDPEFSPDDDEDQEEDDEDEEDDDDEDSQEINDYYKMGSAQDEDIGTDDESEEEKPQPSTSTSPWPCHYATENDHSYHKGKNASMRMVNFGIDTPSDSEEEIDVVSVVDKYSPNNRMGCALPTNPSRSDRRHLQRKMATAMTTNTITSGVKTILPVRKSAMSPEYSLSDKKKLAAEPRITKRAKTFRTAPASPYKRKSAVYGNSSDSEPEPSEKRSLHNNMERQRRIDLRNAFECLRQLVPEVFKKDRAAKVVILREAAKYCDNLNYTSLSLNRQVDDLKRQQERLRMRVSMLRRSLAAKR